MVNHLLGLNKVRRVVNAMLLCASFAVISVSYNYVQADEIVYENNPEIYQGCENGKAELCNKLGEFYYQKGQDFNGKSHSKYMQKSIYFYTKSCDLNDIKGCYNVSLITYIPTVSNTNQNYDSPNYQKTVELYTQLCENNNIEACYYHAKLIEHKLRAEYSLEDWKTANELYGKACEKDYADSCKALDKLNEIKNYIGDNKVENKLP